MESHNCALNIAICSRLRLRDKRHGDRLRRQHAGSPAACVTEKRSVVSTGPPAAPRLSRPHQEHKCWFPQTRRAGAHSASEGVSAFGANEGSPGAGRLRKTVSLCSG